MPVLLFAALAAACGSSDVAGNGEVPESSVPEYMIPATPPAMPAEGGGPVDQMPAGQNGEGIDPGTPLTPPSMQPPDTPDPPVMETPPTQPPPEPTTLRGAADRTERLIGVAVQARLSSDAAYVNAAREFSSVTAENEMKWQTLEPRPNEFNFTGADRIVDFAEQNDMRVRGHTLVWHAQLPAWVSQLETPEAVRSAMLNHIQTVVSRYRGRVFAWDVVNEAWQDGAAALRTSVFQQQLGDGFIDEAFIAARAADPDAKLYYNDYGTEGTNRKANSVFTMVEGMLARGVPIDGVGMQMHVSLGGGPSVGEFASNMQRLVALGLEVNVSELDIGTCGAGTLEERLEAQAQRAHGLVQACVDQPGCDFITVWGVADQYSWRRNDCDEGEALPLLFTAGYEKKPAYTSVFDALMGR